MIISSMVGIDNRSTMDIDTTLKAQNLSIEDISNNLAELISIELYDGISFKVKSISEIMDEAEYPGVRAMLEANLEKMRTPLKIDFSTGDVITPKEITYNFRLMFEDRYIPVLAYNMETILAEKLETILSRSVANTRLRDFYDLRILYDKVEIDYERLKSAFEATCNKRNSSKIAADKDIVISQIEKDEELKNLWANYQIKYDYAREYSWYDILSVLRLFADMV